MPVTASATSVGAGRTISPKSGPTTRQRKQTTSSKRRVTAGAGNSGIWKYYSEDSPGIRVGPVPILVVSLTFIASVFMLHIWGKYSR